MHVTLDTLRQSLLLVEDLAELDDPDGFASRALPALGRLVGCDSLTYNEIGPAPGQVSFVSYPEETVWPGSLDTFVANIHEHPLLIHFRDTSDPGPVKISDKLSRPRFHALGLYADFFRHIPVEDQIAFSLPDPDGKVIGVALNRACRDFSEADRDLLDLIRGHLVNALRRIRRRQRAQQALTQADSAPPAGLTEREAEVIRLVAAGRTNIAAARALGVSPRTVAKHLEHIYRKFDVTSRASAVYQATAMFPPEGAR